METLVLDGKSYVKASKAAKDLGYASDYVGQLCRSGKVAAHLIGRTWYVNVEELASHRTEKKRISRVKAREQAHKSIEEHRIKISKTANTYKNIDIQYERDTEDLIPQTKKLVIKTERVQRFNEDEPFDSRPIIENEGEKVLMSGKLSVTDMSDDAVDSDTTLLTPTKIQTHHVHSDVKKDAENKVKISIEKTPELESVLTPDESEEIQNFSQKLSVLDTQVDDLFVGEQEVVQTQSMSLPVQSNSSVLPYIFAFILMLSLSILSIFFSVSLRYTSEYTPNLSISYDFSFDKTIALLRLTF